MSLYDKENEMIRLENKCSEYKAQIELLEKENGALWNSYRRWYQTAIGLASGTVAVDKRARAGALLELKRLRKNAK